MVARNYLRGKGLVTVLRGVWGEVMPEVSGNKWGLP
jgi:hypothetical protein